MRHRHGLRKLNRTSSHREAMFKNMAASLIRTLGEFEPEDKKAPKVKGRIVTTVAKAKELRPFVEKLITLAKKSLPHEEAASRLNTSAERNSAEWKKWREGDGWQKWTKAKAPAVAARRRAFAALRDKEAVSLLFDTVAPRFADRNGTRHRLQRAANPGKIGVRAPLGG